MTGPKTNLSRRTLSNTRRGGSNALKWLTTRRRAGSSGPAAIDLVEAEAAVTAATQELRDWLRGIDARIGDLTRLVVAVPSAPVMSLAQRAVHLHFDYRRADITWYRYVPLPDGALIRITATGTIDGVEVCQEFSR